MSETVVIKAIMDCGFVGAKHETEIDTCLTKDEWNALDDLQKHEHIEDDLNDFRNNYIDIWYEEIE